MRRADALSTLSRLLPELRRDFGVRRIALFGSTVRGEATEASDLDLLMNFGDGPTFDSYLGLKLFLEDHFGRCADIVTLEALKPRLRAIIVGEAVEVA